MDNLRVDVWYRKINILVWHFWNHLLFWPTLWVLTGFCASPLLSHTKLAHRHKNTTDWRRDNEYQVEVDDKVFFLPSSLHLHWPSNPPSTRKPWSSDSSNHNPLKMSLSSENGSIQKSIKGFNVVGLPWLPRLLSVIHQVALSHSLLLVCARPKTRREHYV